MRVSVWGHSEHLQVIEDMVARAGAEVVAVGSPSSADGALLSDALKTERIDDVRQLIGCEQVDLLWCCTVEDLDPDLHRAIRERGVPAISSEPLPGSIGELLADPGAASTAHFVPLLRRSNRFRAAADVLPELGELRAVNLIVSSGPGGGSLLARLYDAVDFVHGALGDVESVDAALAHPRGAVPETLTALTGCLTANMRFADRRCASITVGHDSGDWYREASIFGDAGWLRCSDDRVGWRTRTGPAEEIGPVVSTPAGPGDLIAAEARRIVERTDPSTPPSNRNRLLACCEAIRLSCRTGENESPARVLEMLSRV